MTDRDTDEARRRVGLCFDCRHARVTRNDRDSAFYLCERSRTDASFARYPALPVAVCAGFERDQAPAILPSRSPS